MRKIAVFGITGDPVTLAHQNVADTVSKSGLVDEVWLQPCWKHRFGKHPVLPKHRIRMCEIACECLSRDVRVSDYEIRNELEGSTYDVLTAMKGDYPDHLFYSVIGMENANVIHTWAKSEQLVAEIPFIVLDRVGIECKSDWFKKPPHIYLPMQQSQEISSTMVRELLHAKSNDVKSLMSQRILDYIENQRLYT